jgi:flagellar biosynthesis component FlhA
MASDSKKGSKEKDAGEGLFDRLSERQERFLVYAIVIIVVLLLFAVEPGFFLGMVLGVLGYRYYLDNYSKSGEAETSK